VPDKSRSASKDSVVVIGSGPPGAAATRLLTDAGVTVTLLEAGLPSAARGLTVRLGGLTVARLHRTLKERSNEIQVTGDSGTLLYEDVSPGGLTNHWSCAVPRFSHDDFEDAKRAGPAYAWPVGYDDLARWYDWVEPFLRISGTVDDLPELPAGKVTDVVALASQWRPVADAARVVGQALIPVPYVYGRRSTLTLSGTVFNAFVRLVRPVERSPHLTIRYGARVTELEWSGASRRVEAVLVRDVRSGATDRIPCRAVIVAAGAVNTAKILLQSTHPDFPDGLGNTHGVLGRYLHDHPLAKLELELAAPMPFHPAACLIRQPLNQSVPLYAAACLQWSGVNMLIRSAISGHPHRLARIGFNVFGTMAPSAANYVALDASRPGGDGTPSTSAIPLIRPKP
jgi:choline dehydrogenase-like flavoprotein